MERQSFWLMIEYPYTLDLTSDDIRAWLTEQLAGKVDNLVAFTEETFGGVTFRKMITGVLIVEHREDIPVEKMKWNLQGPRPFRITDIEKKRIDRRARPTAADGRPY